MEKLLEILQKQKKIVKSSGSNERGGEKRFPCSYFVGEIKSNGQSET